METKWFVVLSPEFWVGGSYDPPEPPEPAHDVALVAANNRKDAMWKALKVWRKHAPHGHVYWSHGGHPLSGVKTEQLDPMEACEELEASWKPFYVGPEQSL